MSLKGIFYDWGGLNVWLFHAINGVHGPIVDRAMLLGTFLGAHQHFPLYAALIALGALVAVYRARDDQGERDAVALRALAVLSVFVFAYWVDGLLVTTLKQAFDLPRPAAALPAATVQIVGHAQFRYSLPSGHTAFAVVIAATLWPVLPGAWRVVALLFALWVALSRVSLGAHFPADVVAGACIGYVSVALVRLGVRRAFT